MPTYRRESTREYSNMQGHPIFSDENRNVTQRSVNKEPRDKLYKISLNISQRISRKSFREVFIVVATKISKDPYQSTSLLRCNS